jgi:bile acid:Na+ symporter, BASS family
MHPVDQLILDFSPKQMSLLNIAMAYIMFSIALDIQMDDFRRVFQYPRSVILGLTVQLLVFPVLTLGIIALFKPPVSVALGMVLVSCCPSGNVTNFLVHRAGANVALSVTLNALIILLASVATPTGFYLWSAWVPDAASQRQQFHIPMMDMALIIIQLIVLPLLVGMLLRSRYPVLAERIRKPSQSLSLVIFFAILLMTLFNNRENLIQYLGYVFIIVLVHNAAGLGAGYGLAKLFRLPEYDARALAFEAGVHNTALGLILIIHFFHGLGGMVLIAAWWGIWDLVTGYLLAEYFRKTKQE